MSVSPLYDDLYGNEIRLIELLPGEPEAQIQCRLFKATLDDPPAYEAISYVWGNPKATETIRCNDQRVQITITLAQALRRLRRLPGKPPRTLWADAISINQTDVSEKNQQVPLMRQIYPVAERVVAWLGLDDANPVLNAIAAIKYIHAMRVRTADGRLNFPKYQDLIQHLQKHGLNPLGASLTNLFSLPYFERVWCAQEAYLAGELLLLAGEEEITGEAIGLFLLWFFDECLKEAREGRIPEDADAINVELMHMPALYLQPTPSTQSDPDLFWTLYHFQRTQATDARDKVYGLLGINSRISGSAPTINVDYNNSVVEVYMNVVVEAISRRKDLDVLSCVEYYEEYVEDPEFPSWTPRWDMQRSIGEKVLLHNTTNVSAGCQITTWTGGFSAVSKTLHLQGIAFDGVLGTSFLLPGLSKIEIDPEFKTILSRLWMEIFAEPVYEHQHSIEELATTLTGGHCGLVQNIDETAAIGGWYSVLEDIDSAAGHQHMADFRATIRMMNLPDSGEQDLRGHSKAFLHLVSMVASGRRIFRTWRGYLGLGPACMQEDDLVVVLDGGKMAYILRPTPDSGHAFMGECFVYAIRNGEAYDMVGENGVERGVFILH